MKISLPLAQIKARYWLLFLGIYLLTSGVSFAVFSSVQKETELTSPLVEETTEEKEEKQVVFTGPKDQECPLNGAMFTRQEREIWEKRRPLLVMIENHADSRPQSGLSRADIIYEAVAEGGITRFMGVYYCAAAAPPPQEYDLGPVRSARTYFLDWASEYSECPLYNHVGGANCSAPEGGACTTDVRAQALEQIEQYGWLGGKAWCDLSYMALGRKQCHREAARTGAEKATEHTMYCDSRALWEKAKDRGITVWDKDYFRPWKFKDGAPVEKRGEVERISFDFWKGYKDYSVVWRYDREKNIYQRENGGMPHLDFLTKEPLKASVVVIQFAKETGPVDIHKHLLYQTTGQGKALVFQDGTVIEGKWRKKDRQSRTLFFDQQGREVKFSRGVIWIEVLPLGSTVDYGS